MRPLTFSTRGWIPLALFRHTRPLPVVNRGRGDSNSALTHPDKTALAMSPRPTSRGGALVVAERPRGDEIARASLCRAACRIWVERFARDQSRRSRRVPFPDRLGGH